MVSILFRCVVVCLFSLLITQVNSQLCQGVSQYGRCSSNSACGCFHMEGAVNIGICGFQWVTCSELAPCDETDNNCPESDQICVRHPRCHDRPICYPTSMMDSQICPPMKTTNSTSATTTRPITTTTQKPAFIPIRASGINIPPNAQWDQNGITLTTEYILPNGTNSTNGLYYPMAVFAYDEKTVYVADPNNNRIMEWTSNAVTGKVVAGGNGRGNEPNQLAGPSDVFVDRETDSLIICDNSNKRIVRWPRVNGKSGETIVSNVSCHGVTMDGNGSIYLSGHDTHEVRRFRKGETQGTVVAGGNGRGSGLNQLNWPQYLFVDRDHSVYVSEWYNSRVMKWVEGAKEGIVVAGGNGNGKGLNQLSNPIGVVVDELGTVYVSDSSNDRIVRWPKGATAGTVIAGGNGAGKLSNQLNHPYALSFDQQNNLYVSDHWNIRIQKFKIL